MQRPTRIPRDRIRRARDYGYPNRLTFTAADDTRMQRLIDINEANSNALIRYLRPQNQRNAFNANVYSGNQVFRMEGRRITRNNVVANNDLLRSMFTRMLNQTLLQNSLSRQLHNFQIVMTSVANQRYLSTNFLSIENVADDMVDKLIAALQSNEELNSTNIRLYVKWYRRRPPGGGYFEQAMDFTHFCSKKKYIYSVSGSDNKCLFRCLALLEAWPDAAQFEYLTKNGNKDQVQGSRGEVIRQNVGRHVDVVEIADMFYYEQYLEKGIIVVEYKSMKIIYEPSAQFNIVGCLLYNDEGNIGHYNFVHPDHIGSLWAKRRFCFICNTAYHSSTHRCIQSCVSCCSVSCDGRLYSFSDFELVCNQCNMSFYDQACKARHKCGNKIRCKLCSKIYPKREEHQCNKYKCYICERYIEYDVEHVCFHMPEVSETEVSDNYIFYDFECYFEGNTHQVACAVAAYAKKDVMYVFYTMDEFMDWLFRKEHKGYTCIAHNSGRYDMHFIKKEMLKRGIRSNDIVNGNTYMYCCATKFKIKFIDSYKFIQSSLRNFTKTFGLTETTKGYFPYRFFTAENLNYVGKMPDMSWFDFDRLGKDDFDAALEWYDNYKDDQINLLDMCITYCKSDVLLLKQGCLSFRQTFLDITDDVVDPFNYITIASVCMDIYKRLFYEEETIAIIDEKCDTEKYEWKAYVENLGYSRIDDGFWTHVKDDRQYAYKSCVDVGCDKCFMSSTVHPIKHIPMYELRHYYNEFRALGQIVTTCSWNTMKEHSAQVKLFMESYQPILSQPVNIRDAFYGGRTEVIKNYHKVTGLERILYLDYTSLYPTIQWGEAFNISARGGDKSFFYYPIGIPKVLEVINEEPLVLLEKYFGVFKVDVTCPKDLYLPLLPERKDGKLLFDLTDKTGTWTSVELQKAVSLGYTITKVHGIIYFEEKSNCLFREYVRLFLKIKYEAAGAVKLGISSRQQAEELADQMQVIYGIDLDIEKLLGPYNAGMYNTAKVCLNSHWGKFGQRQLFDEICDTFDREAFEKIVYCDKHLVKDIFMHDANARTLIYQVKRDFKKNNRNINIAIAAFTTSYARLRLYEALELIGRDVLYMDTDSIVFIGRDPLPVVTGPFLGDLTDELEGDYITEFVATAPKSYAYKTHKGKTVCKVKGVTLDFITSQKVNFDTLKKIVFDGGEIRTRPLTFIIGKDHSITTKDWDNEDIDADKRGKKLGMTSAKRQCINKIDTVPFS